MQSSTPSVANLSYLHFLLTIKMLRSFRIHSTIGDITEYTSKRSRSQAAMILGTNDREGHLLSRG